MQIVLVVFDEAHRASGNYAYCDIVRELQTRDIVFRVLALSATPGSDTKRVQAVVDNLLIERIESRTEESPDVQKYIHQRNVEEHVVKLTPAMEDIQSQFCQLIGVYLKTLVSNGCYSYENPLQASSYGLITRRDAWRARGRNTMVKPLQMKVEACFAISISLMSILQTLQNSGVRCFYNSLLEFTQEVKQKSNPSKTRLEFVNNPKTTRLLHDIKNQMELPNFSSHPKLDKMISIVLDHFQTHDAFVQESIKKGEMVDSQTKIMIFSSHRASVDEIVRILEKHRPLVRPAAFIGQSSGKKTAGLKQKQQLQVIDDFMAGLFNVLVSTSIGEEGLDIGEIDLIICFDVSKSPIRLLQRQGRTGRKRVGNICLLLNEGSDENAVKNARNQYKSIQKVLLEGRKLEFYNGKLAGILPCIYTPTCEQVEIQIPEMAQKIPKKGKSRKSGGPYLPKEEEERYEQLYFRDHRPVKIEISKHLHWQSQSLKRALVPHSSLCEAYISLMEYFAELKSEEERPQVNNVESSTPSKVLEMIKSPLIQGNSPNSNLPSIQDHPEKKKSVFVTIDDSDSEPDFIRKENASCSSKVGILHEERSHSGTALFHGASDIQNPPPPSPNRIAIRVHSSQSPTVDAYADHADVVVPAESPRLYQKVQEDEEEVCDLFTMDPSMHIACFDLSQSHDPSRNSTNVPLLHGNSSQESNELSSNPKMVSKIEPPSSKGDEALVFDEFDDMDFEVIAELERQHRSSPVQTPIQVVSQSEEGSIRAVRRSNRVILDSSSPSLQPAQNMRNTPEGMKRIQNFRQRIADRKGYKRQAPKVRQALSPNALNRPLVSFPKRPKSKKNLLAEEFIDFEAELSGNEQVSADEEDESDRDLSGFVVNNSSLTSPANMSIGFYRRSLLSPNQGGLGKVTGNKFRLAPLKFSKRAHECDDEESLESLADFVVNDSQIEFDSQNPDSFLDESLSIMDELPDAITKSSANIITSELEYFDNEIDIENIDLDDLVEF
jgi:Fanconi anemia group M protein